MANQKVLLRGELMFPSEYVAAVELKGRDCKVTISKVEIENLKMQGGKTERKPVLSFKESKKRMVCNKTNAATIADMHGNEAEKWVGKQIVLYPTRTQCGRDTVDCIRVREGTGRQRSSIEPEPPPADDNRGFMSDGDDPPHGDEPPQVERLPHDGLVDALVGRGTCTVTEATLILERKCKPLLSKGQKSLKDLTPEQLDTLMGLVTAGDCDPEKSDAAE